ncbi:MotA/TolQ/ExbB proton channel family protein [Candidatus Parabeggiatoa sp. HSG14]|uniref:MotA/TolQ/ExbB proton channel family protein n=1 Tax=Candidatus Parabeggiatoa sp. HSG14 TaxID=3055593 RepID=UPI0025A837E2|nr:MotA/TolQ/ExbB proton channel family protein [Thiotrichales bacterium HSG14]
MSNTSEFATSSPNSLLKKFSFWLDNIRFIVILLLGLGTIIVLFPLTYPKSDESLAYLSILIHFFALWGIWISIIVIAKIQVEYAFAIYVDDITSQELQKIKGGEKNRIALEKIKHLLPNNPTEGLAMPRLFQHVITEAKDHRFESSIIAMQPYREEAIGDIFQLQNIQKIALQLGILGTFIGLILALSKLSLDSNNASLELGILFNSLHISFSTSVAGLEVAAILGLLMMVVQQKQKAYFQSMESATDTMISLAQNAIPEELFFTGFQQITNEVSRLNDRVFAQTKEVEVQTKEMRQGIDKLAETKIQFKEFLGQIQDSQKQFQIQIQDSQAHFVEKMMTVYDTFSPKTITTELQQSLDNVVNNILNTFNNNLKPSLDKLTILNTNISDLYQALQTLESQFTVQTHQLEIINQELAQAKSSLYSSTQPLIIAQGEFIDNAVTQLEKGNQELTQSKTDFYSSLQSLITSQNDTFKIFRRDVKAMSQKVATLNQELEKSNEVVQDLVQLITSRKPLNEKIFEQLKMFFQRFR